jgi:glycosyltransferase involved in cell wall biosynthesis
VVRQTLRDIEIICVNDATPDNAGEILQEYAARDDRIKIIEFKENRGVSVARNAGIDVAQGEYVGFVDSDDWLDKEFYDKLYKKAYQKNAQISKGSIIFTNEYIYYLSSLYDVNNNIKLSKFYFIAGFTSAIYNKFFINKSNIRFSEKVSYFEDPYFTIFSVIKCNSVCVTDDAYYYYRKNKSGLSQKINAYAAECIILESNKILSLLNNNIENIDNYIIIYNFLIKHLIYFCNNSSLDINTQKYVTEKLVNILLKCKYKYQCIYYYFRDEGHIRKSIFIQLRSNIIYKDNINKISEYVNSNHNKVIKILVGYIKRSALLKNEILTPIHLGRAVAFESSKDGIITQDEYQWLLDNMIGDDDFTDSISHYNRRVGFLTGIYWAWKNYKKLGNPQYIGNFGYRKLLDIEYIKHFRNVDIVLPKKELLGQTIKSQHIICHGSAVFNKANEILKEMYYKDYCLAKKFYILTTCHLHELYIIKKDIFFEYCEWIFSILFRLLEIPEKEIQMTTKERNLVFKYWLSANKTDRSLNDDKDLFDQYMKRDLAFTLERLTAFYFYKLLQDKSIAYLEVNKVLL